MTDDKPTDYGELLTFPPGTKIDERGLDRAARLARDAAKYGVLVIDGGTQVSGSSRYATRETKP